MEPATTRPQSTWRRSCNKRNYGSGKIPGTYGDSDHRCIAASKELRSQSRRSRSDDSGRTRRGVRFFGPERRREKHFNQDAAWTGKADRRQRFTAGPTRGYARGAGSHWLPSLAFPLLRLAVSVGADPLSRQALRPGGGHSPAKSSTAAGKSRPGLATQQADPQFLQGDDAAGRSGAGNRQRPGNTLP